MKQLYLLVLLFSVSVPFAFSFHPKLNFHKHFKAAVLAIFAVALPFIAWDMYFTSLGVWSFNQTYISGISLYNLPLEEVLFFICIPFCCLFTYYSLKITVLRTTGIPYVGSICIIIGVGVVSIGLLHVEKIYTLWTSIVTGLSLVMLGIKKPQYISQLIISYLVLLIPFFIVNGILTGTGPDSPVVSYNNDENLHFRLLTIPIEDVFYGMTLIFWNIILFELFSKKMQHEHQA